MSATIAAKQAAVDPTKQIVDGLAKLNSKVDGFASEIADLKTKAATPVYPGGVNPANLFHATSGPIGRDSQGYSVLKMAGLSVGMLDKEQAKYEIDVHEKLIKAYKSCEGYSMGRYPNHRTFLIPYSTNHLPTHTSESESCVKELREKMCGAWGQPDPDEGDWLSKRIRTKAAYSPALGTTSDTAGGVLVGFPTLMELIDLQRYMEVFTRAGATEQALPANARMQYPKLTGGATAYWIGEGASITQSQETTGYLDLQGKKLGIFVPINNELLRYASPASEGMVRSDMAAVAALKADLAQLEGTGGTQIAGLISGAYGTGSVTSWTQGVDQLLGYSVTSSTFQPQDVYGMQGVLPDPVQAMKKSFIMRNDLWGKVRGRRADAVSGGDAKGTFVFNITRTGSENIPDQLDGYPVVASSQVSKTRGNGSQTYVICGAFADWIIARFGVMEILASNLSDQAMANDQTIIRAIQILDAGPRHPASFVFADSITIQ